VPDFARGKPSSLHQGPRAGSREQRAGRAAKGSIGSRGGVEPDSPTLQHSLSGSEQDVLSPGSPFADAQPVPSKWDVSQFVAEIMQIFQMQPQVSIIAVVYLDRFSEQSGIAFSADNWRRLIFTSLILASKVWDEMPFDTEELAQISEMYSLDELSALERVFLQALEFNLSVHDTEYAKIQRRLHKFGSKLSMPVDILWATLDQERAALLKERCLKEEASLRQRYSVRHDFATD